MTVARLTIFDDIVTRSARVFSTARRREIAADIAAEARAAAPVLTGQYRDGIAVEASGDDVRVVDNDPDAVYKEYGTSDTPAHAALTDAARRRGRYSGWQPR
ncbi:HK97 gp10 family phage protein [Nocardia sp. CDC159]|uniref:HK97 gp10 family phage protein n=1 Tax=Nocardia pulmonis TaxID=2951408 RepID=A0A9X2EBY2_9NOCA|nr:MULTISPECIES: HK97 gp10 family phage protein [Nocardia]MCM6778032.1 HK97 gp10 family phage protein [Nocardia pulmonis]MCM6790797.1 HK97 gp10 family phage protein [Nocardia sp. CDC159]